MCERNPEECDCPCHKINEKQHGDSFMVHMFPCCHMCQHCRLRVSVAANMETHLAHCPKNPVSQKKE